MSFYPASATGAERRACAVQRCVSENTPRSGNYPPSIAKSSAWIKGHSYQLVTHPVRAPRRTQFARRWSRGSKVWPQYFKAPILQCFLAQYPMLSQNSNSQIAEIGDRRHGPNALYNALYAASDALYDFTARRRFAGGGAFGAVGASKAPMSAVTIPSPLPSVRATPR
jgi:hypothetical protein